MCFCSLFRAHKLPPSFQVSCFQAAHKHRDAFPWKLFWGSSHFPALRAAHSPTVLADCTCRCMFPRDVYTQESCQPLNPSQKSVGSTWKVQGLQWHPWLRRCAAPPKREELGSKLPSVPRHDVCSLWAQGSRGVCQQNDRGRWLWWMRVRHLFCDPLHPHLPCYAEAQKWQTITLPAHCLLTLHFCISCNTGYLQAVRNIFVYRIIEYSKNRRGSQWTTS